MNIKWMIVLSSVLVMSAFCVGSVFAQDDDGYPVDGYPVNDSTEAEPSVPSQPQATTPVRTQEPEPMETPPPTDLAPTEISETPPPDPTEEATPEPTESLPAQNPVCDGTWIHPVLFNFFPVVCHEL